MKERMSFTLDKESVEILEHLLKKVKYRNRSHIVEVALRALQEQEEREQASSKKGRKR